MEPALLKSLKLLRGTAESLSEKDIVQRVEEDQVYVAGALEKLIKRNVVIKNGDFYRYQKTSFNEEFFQKILAVYDKIRKPKMQLIVRGLLSKQLYPFPNPLGGMWYIFRGIPGEEPCLFHLDSLIKILQEEGFNLEEIKHCLEEEMKGGWIGRIEFYLGTKRQITPPAPIRMYIHPHFFMTLRRIEVNGRINREPKDRELVVIHRGKMPSTISSFISDELMSAEEIEGFKREFKERWKGLGWFIREEAYLLGQYPSELANPAREYLDNERPEIEGKIWSEPLKLDTSG